MTLTLRTIGDVPRGVFSPSTMGRKKNEKTEELGIGTGGKGHHYPPGSGNLTKPFLQYVVINAVAFSYPILALTTICRLETVCLGTTSKSR